MVFEVSSKEDQETATAPTTEEAITTPKFSNKEDQEIATTPVIEEAITTPEFSNK